MVRQRECLCGRPGVLRRGEDTAARCDLASPCVGRVRLCREHRATNELMYTRGYVQVMKKKRGPGRHRPSTFNQGIQGSNP